MIHTQVPIAAPSNGTIIPTFHSYTHARSTCLDGCAKKKKDDISSLVMSPPEIESGSTN